MGVCEGWGMRLGAEIEGGEWGKLGGKWRERGGGIDWRGEILHNLGGKIGDLVVQSGGVDFVEV
ncbi:hypothetical protein FACS1894188_09530 [Clostridia bacterium]|nr:hypothetical protein FACS1894188_09530 [Clostridia bacterium]